MCTTLYYPHLPTHCYHLPLKLMLSLSHQYKQKPAPSYLHLLLPYARSKTTIGPLSLFIPCIDITPQPEKKIRPVFILITKRSLLWSSLKVSANHQKMMSYKGTTSLFGFKSTGNKKGESTLTRFISFYLTTGSQAEPHSQQLHS